MEILLSILGIFGMACYLWALYLEMKEQGYIKRKMQSLSSRKKQSWQEVYDKFLKTSSKYQLVDLYDYLQENYNPPTPKKND